MPEGRTEQPGSTIGSPAQGLFGSGDLLHEIKGRDGRKHWPMMEGVVPQGVALLNHPPDDMRQSFDVLAYQEKGGPYSVGLQDVQHPAGPGLGRPIVKSKG